MWWEHLDNLRAKPKAVRQKIAFGVSSAIFLVIFSVWISSKNVSMSGTGVAISEVTTPLALVSKAFVSAKEDTKDAVNEMQQQIIQTLATSTMIASSTDEEVELRNGDTSADDSLSYGDTVLLPSTADSPPLSVPSGTLGGGTTAQSAPASTSITSTDTPSLQ